MELIALAELGVAFMSFVGEQMFLGGKCKTFHYFKKQNFLEVRGRMKGVEREREEESRGY